MDTDGRRTRGESLWRLVYPEQCVLCARLLPLDRRHLCADCRGKLPWIREPRCPRCGAPTGADANLRRGCATCWNRPFAFEQATAPLRYDGAARELVLRFKLAREASLAHPLGQLLCDHLAEGGVGHRVDVVVPVPLHWMRQFQRGFNQARLLALEIGDRFGLPVLPGLLRRIRRTTTQTAFSRLRRDANVRGAFAVRSARLRRILLGRWAERLLRRPALLGKRVLLVDDVMTTGATVNECSRVLREAGAAEVLVATLTRATR